MTAQVKALPEIQSERVIARLAKPAEAAELIRFYSANRAHFELYEPKRDAAFYTAEYWAPALEKRLAEFQADQSALLCLYLKSAPGQVIGTLHLSNIMRRYFQACHLGYSLGAEHEGQGYMTEILRAAIAYAFGELNLHRIMANFIPGNERSARVLGRLGFKHEGLAKHYLFINGQWQDHVLTSLVNPDWKLPEKL